MKCDKCGNQLASRYGLKNHYNRRHPTTPFEQSARQTKIDGGAIQYVCKLCDHFELSKRRLFEHRREAHLVEFDQRTQHQVYISFCWLSIVMRDFQLIILLLILVEKPSMSILRRRAADYHRFSHLHSSFMRCARY